MAGLTLYGALGQKVVAGPLSLLCVCVVQIIATLKQTLVPGF